jgi:hypothetical protein
MANRRKKNKTKGFGFGRGVGDLESKYMLNRK